jgi:hypothetical protein
MRGVLAMALVLLPALSARAAPDAAPLGERLSLYADQYRDLRTGRARTVVLRVYRGLSRRPLDPEEFYELVQRPDLARTFRATWTEKVKLVTSGLALASAGLGLIIGAILGFHGTAAWMMGVSGGAFFSIGWVMAQAGANVFPHPIDAAQARQMVEAYNAGLRPQAAAPAPEAAPGERPVRWQVVPWLQPGLGGIALRASY